ncbi:MAG: hypothetical protein J6P72_04735, partial [Firmicutes bacterium]|nr:hypothetical protein [Bacillota bacterium]
GRKPSWAEINKEGKSFLKLPMFKQLAKSPERMQSYLKNQNYTDLVQKMNAPFMEGSVEKKREVLEKLKMFSQNRQLMDGPEGRSDKWKNLLSSMQEIDTSKPETYDRQLEKVFGHTEAYMKGKKTKSSDAGIDRRFEQCLDILGIVAETSDFARDRANILVDRTNHVRTRWLRSQPTVSIEVGSRDAVKQIDSQHAQLMKAKKDPVALEDIKGDAAYDAYTLVGEVEQISESRKASRNLSMVSNI